MNQEQYFKIGTEKKLPLRCPILNYCSRRAYTIYYNSEFSKYKPGLTVEDALLKEGILPEDFKKKVIDIQGEPPSWIKGNSNSFFTGMCPEVNLFDSGHSLHPNLACVSAEYDEYYSHPKHRVIKCQHFSECPEFNKYLFDNPNAKRKPDISKRRKYISAKTKAILQKEIKSKCPFCPSEDVEHFHVHHIDENPANNLVSNLLMLCPTCHSKVTKKDISYEKVILVKSSTITKDNY